MYGIDRLDDGLEGNVVRSCLGGLHSQLPPPPPPLTSCVVGALAHSLPHTCVVALRHRYISGATHIVVPDSEGPTNAAAGHGLREEALVPAHQGLLRQACPAATRTRIGGRRCGSPFERRRGAHYAVRTRVQLHNSLRDFRPLPADPGTRLSGCVGCNAHQVRTVLCPDLRCPCCS